MESQTEKTTDNQMEGVVVYVGVALNVLVKKGPLGIHFLKRGS